MLPILQRSGPRAWTGGGPFCLPAAREMLWVAADRPVICGWRASFLVKREEALREVFAAARRYSRLLSGCVYDRNCAGSFLLGWLVSLRR